MDWEAQTCMCQWTTSTVKNSLGCTALDMLGWREMTEQIDWQEKQPSQVACVSEDLKCWAAWGHKAKNITPSVAWRREVWTEEAVDDLPWKDERRPPSTRQTLELFQRQHPGNLWEMGWSAYMGFSKHIETVLNWTEPNKALSSMTAKNTHQQHVLVWKNLVGLRKWPQMNTSLLKHFY